LGTPTSSFDVCAEQGELIAAARRAAAANLLASRGTHGHWEGYLSSSALSTATACIAFCLHARAASNDGDPLPDLVPAGMRWLVENQNRDGGWGDTTDSPSNMSTTLLVWVALGLAPGTDLGAALNGCEAWLKERAGDLSAKNLARVVAKIYGDDKTFAVPIQVTCALGGRLGRGPAAWRSIPALPFELAALPHRFFSSVGLPMVSYAMPALIAIGQVIDRHKRNLNPFTALTRAATRSSTLRTLKAIQPSSGGFLEATPLTSFVCLSLIGCGLHTHAVVADGMRFLRESARADGSWPIDTNLATWVTSLSIDALGGAGDLGRHLDADARAPVASWLAGQQYREVHPYTHAAPGGWAWTDLPGGVPDADDTPAALLALAQLGKSGAAPSGVAWLLGLQNRDGGMPTFCRGWGKLPFDHSCPDLAAHALRAFAACSDELSPTGRAQAARACERAARYLIDTQRIDGAWVPLWFGNQQEPSLENPLYGTSRVVKACSAVGSQPWRDAMERGVRWMLSAQHGAGEHDGGFGGAPGLSPSIEETGLAVDALATFGLAPDASRDAGLAREVHAAVARGAAWLARATEAGERFDTTPIGLYFAKLWYSERLYPLIFTVAALERAARLLKL
jgi:squalene-hopene/tetraprenyl-beta-curcumene cyclase